MDEYRKRLATLSTCAYAQGCTIDGVRLDALNEPVLSVITVAFNSARTIERTLQSIFAQSYRAIECIVIDGGSADETPQILHRLSGRIAYWHSATDRGISDAFNLGIAASHGKHIAIVNSDDWMSPDQAAVAVHALEVSAAGFVFGRLAYYDRNAELTYTMEGDADYWRDGFWRMPYVNHPTVVVSRSAYDIVGLFDVSRRVAMDYDWHLRAELRGVHGIYVPELLGHMTTGGTCDRNWRLGLREVRDIAAQRLNAHVRPELTYVTRLTRAYCRLALTRLMPKALVAFIHRKFNPRYLPALR